MEMSYTAVIQRHGEWWIGWVEEVPGVNSQGTTREELLDNLRDALDEALEMNRQDARAAAAGAFEEVSLVPVKRHDLVRHLQQHGCGLVREGRRHSWWGNPVNGRRFAVPRHTEIPVRWHARSAATWESQNRDSFGLNNGLQRTRLRRAADRWR